MTDDARLLDLAHGLAPRLAISEDVSVGPVCKRLTIELEKERVTLEPRSGLTIADSSGSDAEAETDESVGQGPKRWHFHYSS